MRIAGFEQCLRALLRRSLRNSYTDNHSKYYAQGLRRVQYLDMIALEAFTPEKRQERLRESEQDVLAVIEAMTPLYERLGDEYSRLLLLLVGAYRIIGYRHIRFPYYRPDAIHQRELLAARTRLPDDPAMLPLLQELRREWFCEDIALYNLHAAGRKLLLYTTPETLYMEWRQPAYRYRNGNIDIGVAAGDLVIDCGAGLGDQAVFFADAVGEKGFVACLEPHPANSKICFANMRLNSRLQGRIRLFRLGAWDKEAVGLPLSRDGASSRIQAAASPDGAGRQAAIRCRAIDSLVGDLPRKDVSLIKMDIEGAEKEALRGASGVIAAHRPKLAISVYHSLEDFRAIPALIDSLYPGYRLYLDHHSVDSSDTVLYAVAEG